MGTRYCWNRGSGAPSTSASSSAKACSSWFLVASRFCHTPSSGTSALVDARYAAPRRRYACMSSASAGTEPGRSQTSAASSGGRSAA